MEDWSRHAFRVKLPINGRPIFWLLVLQMLLFISSVGRRRLYIELANADLYIPPARAQAMKSVAPNSREKRGVQKKEKRRILIFLQYENPLFLNVTFCARMGKEAKERDGRRKERERLKNPPGRNFRKWTREIWKSKESCQTLTSVARNIMCFWNILFIYAT